MKIKRPGIDLYFNRLSINHLSQISSFAVERVAAVDWIKDLIEE